MTTAQVADRLVSLCREGKFEEAQIELYADDALSTEPEGGALETVTSKQAVIESGRKFRASLDAVHALTISGPIISGPVFAVTFALDADFKGSGRGLFEEVCASKVENGKIVKASYLY